MSVESRDNDQLLDLKLALKSGNVEQALAGLGEISKDNVVFTGETYKVGLEFTNRQEGGLGNFSGLEISEGFINRFDLAFNKQEQFESLA